MAANESHVDELIIELEAIQEMMNVSWTVEKKSPSKSSVQSCSFLHTTSAASSTVAATVEAKWLGPKIKRSAANAFYPMW